MTHPYSPVHGNPEIQYNGKYLGQVEPTESRISEEYTQIPKKLVKERK